MTNETIRIATGMRLGISICEPHLCSSGKQVENRAYMVSHIATVLQGSVSTTWSATSFGEPCRGPQFQQQRNHQVYYEVTTSIQMVSRLHRGSKVNVWHGMWQCLTPMHNHICQHSHERRICSTQVSHLQDSKVPEHLADPPVHTDCNRNSCHMEQLSKRMHQRTWETYHHCHRGSKRDKLYLSASLSGNSEMQHADFHCVFHHRHGLNTKNNSSNNSDDNNNINN